MGMKQTTAAWPSRPTELVGMVGEGQREATPRGHLLQIRGEMLTAREEVLVTYGQTLRETQ
jgi:hypothetical protein